MLGCSSRSVPWRQDVRIYCIQTAEITARRITWLRFLGHKHEAEYMDSCSPLKKKSFSTCDSGAEFAEGTKERHAAKNEWCSLYQNCDMWGYLIWQKLHRHQCITHKLPKERSVWLCCAVCERVAVIFWLYIMFVNCRAGFAAAFSKIVFTFVKVSKWSIQHSTFHAVKALAATVKNTTRTLSERFPW